MKNIKSLFCIALAGATLSSCNDFLTLMPLNEIVYENYWTSKADVESVLLGAYSALESGDCITRMSIWGEMRSDNIIADPNNTSSSGSTHDIIQITKDNILETNSFTTWDCFYKAINRANTVIKEAPLIKEKDPNYTRKNLNSNLAEAYAIRDLCHWYLARAYRAAPFITEPSTDDSRGIEAFKAAPITIEEMIPLMIEELEEVVDAAMIKYPLESANTGRFTQAGIYALLADLYLWKGDYPNVVRCVDKITELKMDEYKELKEEDEVNCIIDMFHGYPLIKETQGTQWAGTSYNENFGTGNSFEVLFELPFQSNQSNSFVNSYYGTRSQDGVLQAATQMGTNVKQGKGDVFKSKYDTRFYESISEVDDGSKYAISKYVVEKQSFDLSTGEIKQNENYPVQRNNTTPNWVVYRYTDALLMKAEALVMMAADDASVAGDSAANANRNSYFRQAFNIVQAINQRALCTGYEGGYTNSNADTLKIGDYSGSKQSMENLVLQERRRELCFEGKRWFDLVRMARRDGSTTRLSSLVLTKYTENVSAVRIKLSDTFAMYFPYNKDEIKLYYEDGEEGVLKQNPAYKEDEDIKKAGQ
ncbi:MAG: RagB/SusD family nutrient uptake outer membrane protein [Bacteroidaceae bacterium]|nr:RagB/SusD family nutrient uptake outer membrane protein [Bacteroidaceae bacterium]